MYPFLGNHFNILFINGAGVLFIYTIIEFWDNVSLDNELMSAAFYYICFGYKLVCETLELIDKLVTVPLWRTMIKRRFEICHYIIKKCFILLNSVQQIHLCFQMVQIRFFQN